MRSNIEVLGARTLEFEQYIHYTYDPVHTDGELQNADECRKHTCLMYIMNVATEEWGFWKDCVILSVRLSFADPRSIYRVASLELIN